MSDIVEFPNKDLKETSYSGGQGRDLGVITKDKRLEIIKLNKREFLVVTPDGSQVHDRSSLAEFLYVASIFLDSEGKWAPEVDLIGSDY